MIPRKMISAWFGRGDPAKHERFAACMESWRRVHPDWEYVRVDEDSLPPEIMDTPYVRGVLGRGEFVKATEIARLWGLWRHGGIYVDFDVELVKPFDPLLDRRFMIGREDEHTINGAVLGSRPMEPTALRLIKAFPLHDEGRATPPVYGPSFLTDFFRRVQPGQEILPPRYFYPSHWRDKARVEITPDTYAIHHWAASWEPYR